jgi:hypothetical protein
MSERRTQPNARPTVLRRAALPAIGAAWAALVTAGLAAVWSYHATPGAVAAAVPAAIAGGAPAGDDALVAPGRTSLLVFLHPQCPCSAATLDAVEGLIAAHRDAGPRVAERLRVTAVFADVGDGGRDASEGPTWRRAAAIAGLRIVRDADGAIARRFDARTSGQVLCYGTVGTLAFNGGLTAGRGAAGDSDGARAVAAIAAGRPPLVRATDVFGCELQ